MYKKENIKYVLQMRWRRSFPCFIYTGYTVQ